MEDSLWAYMEGLEADRSTVMESIEEELEAWSGAGYVSSPDAACSPDVGYATSSPSTDPTSPAVQTVRQNQGIGGDGQEASAYGAGTIDTLLGREGVGSLSFRDLMDEDGDFDDVIAQYQSSSPTGGFAADPMDIDLPFMAQPPSQPSIPAQSFPQFAQTPVLAAPPHQHQHQQAEQHQQQQQASLQHFLSLPSRLTDADVQFLTNNQAHAMNVDVPAAAATQPSSKESRPKQVKDLRLEFYRQEIRRQTNGKHTAGKFRVGDVESRSPYFVSFIWRKYVNAIYNIRIPPFRDPDTGMLDTEQLLRQKMRSSRTPLKQLQLDKVLKEAISNADSRKQPGRYRGDIAYYFRKSVWAVTEAEAQDLREFAPEGAVQQTEDGLWAYTEIFQPGDIVAVLADGSVTKDTTRQDVALISVVPGDERSLIAPWKCLPEPAPEPVADYSLVAVMGIVQVRVTGTVPENSDETYVIVPSGHADGTGVVLPQRQWASASAVQPIVALPLAGKEEEGEGLLLAFRSEQINVPWLQRLEDKTTRLETRQNQHSEQITAISTAVDELQAGGALSPGDPRERLELQQRPRLKASHTQMASAGMAPCKCLARLLSTLEDQGKSLQEVLVEAGENVVTVSGHPYAVQYAMTKETGERLPVENVAIVQVGKVLLAVQAMNKRGTETAKEEESAATPGGEETKGETEAEEESGKGASTPGSAIAPLSEEDLRRLEEGEYSARINQECAGCEIMLDDRFVLRLLKVRRWNDGIEDIVAQPMSGMVTKEPFLPGARMCLREFRGRRRRYIGGGRLAKRIARSLLEGSASASEPTPRGGHIGGFRGHRHRRHHGYGHCGEAEENSDSDGEEQKRERCERERCERGGEERGRESAGGSGPSSCSRSPSDTADGGQRNDSEGERQGTWGGLARLLERPCGVALFARKLVVKTWKKGRGQQMALCCLSPREQERLSERMSGALLEAAAKEELCVGGKKRSKAAAQLQELAKQKHFLANPLGQLYWAAHNIAAWELLFAADKKGFDVFAAGPALHALAVASSTIAICQAIARRSELLAVLCDILSVDKPIASQFAALRIMLALASSESVLRTLGTDLEPAIKYCASLLPASCGLPIQLRTAAYSFVSALASEGWRRQQLLSYAAVQQAVLLHGYESDSSPLVQELGEAARHSLTRIALVHADKGRELDSNVPLRCKRVEGKRGAEAALGIELSRLEMGSVGGAQAAAVLLRLPFFSSTLLPLLERNHFLELELKPTAYSTSTKRAKDSPSESSAPGLQWTALWLLDGRLLASSAPTANSNGWLATGCRLPAPPSGAALPSKCAPFAKFVASVAEKGWRKQGLFSAPADQGLCVVLLAATDGKKRAGLRLRNVEIF
mmetsp:Transcript_6866/g.28958  ORF Transcript_6866/g.28958 Transcript_6866/m.28958 type:complete len:1371 (-) Transcript_6866:56-4168(-)|eukprot:CAMPEP_0114619472 /NCGR_PEP_ID=MMETSP0168-20121206/8231_1 /TAXON_ID=95228 ORGANISM="Vannella sp., Strain DIVA3 517/6/12" /NCGR_SAMPLE_ID=MMETSP0168 /ASSEMBLY_ACC=CAM_ASM_000044 /LENGTH=1370 /DNA_ID=CAMNT_0001830641 /DNA_START=168 /DNA_END=4280 /DNA_ORIENTATION=-